MRLLAFSARNRKEITRDPLTVIFGLLMPLALMLMAHVLAQSVPAPQVRAENFAPGMAVFSLSFMAMFSGVLVSKDRTSAFLMRLRATPLTTGDYIYGYTLPLLPVGLAQGFLCLLAALLMGVPLSVNLLLALAALIPSALLFIALGVLFGTCLTDKQVSGLGSLLVNLATLLGGTWFELELIGGTFARVCRLLPFAHAVDAVRAALAGNYGAVAPHLAWVLGYTALFFALATLLLRRTLRR